MQEVYIKMLTEDGAQYEQGFSKRAFLIDTHLIYEPLHPAMARGEINYQPCLNHFAVIAWPGSKATSLEVIELFRVSLQSDVGVP